MGTSRIEGHALSDSNLKSCNSTILKTSGRTCVAGLQGVRRVRRVSGDEGLELGTGSLYLSCGIKHEARTQLKAARCGVAQHC